MSWTLVADVVAAIFLLCGAFLAFAAGVGVVRFPDLLARMHAATKPQVLGLILVLVALALRLRSWSAVGMLVLVVIFQLMTSPVAAHMVGRAGYRTGKVRPDLLVLDDLTADQEAADREKDEADREKDEADREATARAADDGGGPAQRG
ncbi:monovalent cation/H(+) antiporter subunit G [Oerskovia sp. Sa1BUA8]|uniref:Monovalent cation/H(+) antiporter subunit G n=1 Tax=Oerskovia douganii TaxID=2762210 RepID=A0A9D5UF08_9CELL|nr:monovalent cation/H(+) antiporter subunit G [Oerskovia douganii]MBE7701841.1 monovalent cation/H(+) antiporter subunit G [Oerskovia douganii]